jgi:glycosyltransferase involved in cell wall biosynthesis
LLKDQLVGTYQVASSRVLVVHHGVSRPPRESPPWHDEEKQLVSLVGRIDQYKGVEEFLRVARYFDREQDAHLTFLLGGEGDLAPYRKALEDLRNLEIINRRLTNDELDRLLERSLVCLLPYRDGSQSGNIPVAYYNACPVIVTSVGALPEIVKSGETGFVVPPGDSQAMIRHIETLLGDAPKRKEMGFSSFSYYLEFMQYSKITPKITAFLRQAVAADQAEEIQGDTQRN